MTPGEIVLLRLPQPDLLPGKLRPVLEPVGGQGNQLSAAAERFFALPDAETGVSSVQPFLSSSPGSSL